MSKNIIDAICTLVERKNYFLTEVHTGKNRMNETGYALEDYVKNLFADTFDCNDTERLIRQNEIFSYLGNDANPPDMMLRNGDAVEVKKIQSNDSALALNSSFPKKFLSSSNPMISKACRDAETWSEKDIIYTVGVVRENILKHLCMVYGRDYCASEEHYNKIRQEIKSGVENIPNVEFAVTRELGRVNHADPLGITYLRVRGMWHIENPWKVFRYVYERNFQADFNFMSIIDSEKWNTLENRNLLFALQKKISGLKISDVKIKNPDNPDELKDAKLIAYEVLR